MRTDALSALGRFTLVGVLIFAAGCSGLSAAAPKPGPHIVQGLSATPTSLSMGPTDTAGIDATEPGYAGSYSATSSDTTIATVSPNGAAQFVVTGVAVGKCNVTVTDTNGHQAVVSVSIQTVVVGGQ